MMDSNDHSTLLASINSLSYAGDTIAGEVSMVGQRVQTRARSATVIGTRCLEGMVAMNIYELLLNIQYTLHSVPLQRLTYRGSIEGNSLLQVGRLIV